MAVLRCTEAFAYSGPQGVPQVCTPGMLVDDKDPAVKGHEHWFEPVEVTAARVTNSGSAALVEQATAEPGEKRSTKRTSKVV